jgi:hypothetical protein
MAPSEKKPVSTKLATAVPGALAAVLLIGAVAFGASTLRSAAPQATALEPAAGSTAEDVEPRFGATVAQLRRDAFAHDPKPAPAGTEAPKPEATEQAKPTEAPKPTPAPEIKPAEQPQQPTTEKPMPAQTPKPEPPQPPAPDPVTPTALVLEGWAKETKAKLAWTPYAGAGFSYYKVVRSGDSHVTWPASGDDELIGAIGDVNAPWGADKPPCGMPWHYAVFAVQKAEGAYVTLAVSNVVAVTVECAPPPAPIVVTPLAFQVTANPGAGLTLSWEPCWSGGFQAYKVVRSGVHADPRFPLNDGSELIAVIGDPSETVFVDGAVLAGETWSYRVVAVTKRDGAYVPLCETAAMAATAQ